jgi:hypothetical protein
MFGSNSNVKSVNSFECGHLVCMQCSRKERKDSGYWAASYAWPGHHRTLRPVIAPGGRKKRVDNESKVS